MIRRALVDVDARRVPGTALADGALLAAAGGLLLVPGFVTDVIGLLLLVPPVRAGVRCTISTDSRTVADTTLSHEFELAAGMGLTDDELKLCNDAAYEARFGG